LRVMLPVLERAVPCRAGRNVADALIGAFATHYRCELPGDADVLAQIRRPNSGDALENLVAAGTVPAQDILRLGLMVLSALAGLCRGDGVSVIGQAAGQGERATARHWWGVPDGGQQKRLRADNDHRLGVRQPRARKSGNVRSASRHSSRHLLLPSPGGYLRCPNGPSMSASLRR